MAQHIWETKNLKANTIQRFDDIREIAINEYGYSLNDANAIALYVSEMIRQKGKGIPMGCTSSERGLTFMKEHQRRLIKSVKRSTINKYSQLFELMNLENEREQL